jgi:hypothetical protein
LLFQVAVDHFGASESSSWHPEFLLTLYILVILYIFGDNVHSSCVLRLTIFFSLSDESPVVDSIFTKLHARSLILCYARQVPAAATANNKLTYGQSSSSLIMAFGCWISTNKNRLKKSNNVDVCFRFWLIYVCTFSLAVFISVKHLPLPRPLWPWWAIFNQIENKSRYKASIYSNGT